MVALWNAKCHLSRFIRSWRSHGRDQHAHWQTMERQHICSNRPRLRYVMRATQPNSKSEHRSLLWRNLFSVESFWRVERLDERGGVADEHGVAGGTGQHTDHSQPDVGRALGRVSAVADTQHVRERLEQRPRVLLVPRGTLNNIDIVHSN